MISAGVLHDTDNSGLMSVPVAVVLSDLKVRISRRIYRSSRVG